MELEWLPFANFTVCFCQSHACFRIFCKGVELQSFSQIYHCSCFKVHVIFKADLKLVTHLDFTKVNWRLLSSSLTEVLIEICPISAILMVGKTFVSTPTTFLFGSSAFTSVWVLSISFIRASVWTFTSTWVINFHEWSIA